MLATEAVAGSGSEQSLGGSSKVSEAVVEMGLLLEERFPPNATHQLYEWGV